VRHLRGRHNLTVAAAGNYQNGTVSGIGGGKIDIDRGTISIGTTERSGHSTGIDIESLTGPRLRVQETSGECKQK
jgi:hypothetical protein